MRIEILTIFPDIFSGFLSGSLIGKAIERELLTVALTNFRDFADPPHHQVDDTPYGGGAGMVLRPEPLVRAIRDARARLPNAPVILLSASGSRFTQGHAQDLSGLAEMILVCGRYEGVDQRAIDLEIDQELSIGDYVLMGGEVGAMVLIEATTRLIGGVLGNNESIEHESFSTESTPHLIEGPHFTRPAEFEGHKVPEVLLSGDHKKISAWRHEQSLKSTQSKRPDLFDLHNKK